MDNYKQIEREVTIKVRNAKRNMEKKLAYAKNNSARNFASYIKSKTKARTAIGPLKDEQGVLVSDETEIAEKLNKYFSSVFTEEDLATLPQRDMETAATLDEISIEVKDIVNRIKKLKEHSASGPDGISPKMLKMDPINTAAALKILFTKSVQTGEIPRDWKHATVIPIHKKGTLSDPGNYRPVSLTSVPGKILEAIIKDAIMKHLEANKLLRDSQHGFMQGRSCTTNLIVFMDKLTEIVDRGKAADIFYLDFSKAFDKVPTRRLLLKMRLKGIQGKIHKWIEQWLTNRTQAVKIGEVESGSSDVKSGVPQGSVLGPPLFDIFIDDVDTCAELIDLLIKFADDTKGLQEISGEEDRVKLQQTLDKLVEWAREWGMQFNIAKCKIMHVGNNNPGYKYKMEGQELVEVDEEKDIGVTVSSTLKPAKHCQKAAGMARSVLSSMK